MVLSRSIRKSSRVQNSVRKVKLVTANRYILESEIIYKTTAVSFPKKKGRWERVGFLTQYFLASAIFNIQTRKVRINNILTNQIAEPYVHKRPNQIPKN
jgi:predicted amino acid racemase